MIGKAAVTGLGAAMLLGSSAAGVAVAFETARDGGASYAPVDLRKSDDEPELILVDDDDDADEDQNQTGTNTGTRSATGDGDNTAGDDGTSGGDNTGTRTGTAAGGVRISAGQLLINQRISQAAVRRANALLGAERS